MDITRGGQSREKQMRQSQKNVTWSAKKPGEKAEKVVVDKNKRQQKGRDAELQLADKNIPTDL